MEAVLDELTLVECNEFEVRSRIEELARVLRSLDELGAPRVVRTVSDAGMRIVSEGQGLNKWCFDHSVDRDAGRLVAGRMSAQPYIDGNGGLMLAVEEGRAIECTVGTEKAVGLAYCYFTEGFPVGLSGSSFTSICNRQVSIYCVSESEDWRKDVTVGLLLSPADVEREKESLIKKVDSRIGSGYELLDRATEVFPNLRFGKGAVDQLSVLQGTEPQYPSIIRHLRAFQFAAVRSAGTGAFDPEVSWSPESDQTLQHPRFGPMREFPWPAGSKDGRWSNHSKTGNIRIYFEPILRPNDETTEVCVGYVGRHLPTVDHPN